MNIAEGVMEGQVSAAETRPSTESSLTTDNVEENVEAQISAVEPESSSDSSSTEADDDSHQGMTDTPRTSVSTFDAELPAAIAQDSQSINSSNDRSENSPTVADFTPAEHRELLRRVADSPRLKLRELVGDYTMSEEFRHIPYDWTLLKMLNYVIEKDIVLPTDENLDGDREENARLCEEAAKIPLAPRRLWSEDEEWEMQWLRQHPGEIYPRDDLWEICQPREKVFCRDPDNGKWKKRFLMYDPAKPQPLCKAVAKTTSKPEAVTQAVEGKEAEKEDEEKDRKGKEKEEVEVKEKGEEEKENGENSLSGAGLGAEEARVMMDVSEVTSSDDVLGKGKDKVINTWYCGCVLPITCRLQPGE
ncbi:MAG: hypothetical protein LQ352_001243 [Teloschistes flavicans]|nr:MAG: hypothetical protein LQ352_001243 [Teloschistes flavicans]